MREAVAQRGEEGRQVLHLQIAVQLGKDARDDQPVLERVAHAERRLGAVGNDPPAAVGRAREVDGVNVQPDAARHWDADAGAQEARVAVDQRRRQQALAQQVLRAVEVAQDAVEQVRALRHCGLDFGPLLGRQEQRQDVEIPGAVDAARVRVDVVGDAVLADLRATVSTRSRISRPEARSRSSWIRDQCGRGVPARRTSRRSAARQRGTQTGARAACQAGR